MFRFLLCLAGATQNYSCVWNTCVPYNDVVLLIYVLLLV